MPTTLSALSDPSSDWYHAYCWGKKMIIVGALLGVWAGWWWGEVTYTEDEDERALALFGPHF